MQLLNFTFKYIDFKNVNIESCESICNNCIDYIYQSIQNSSYCELGKEIIEKIIY